MMVEWYKFTIDVIRSMLFNAKHDSLHGFSGQKKLDWHNFGQISFQMPKISE